MTRSRSSPLRATVERYLALKRALGRRYDFESLILLSLVGFLEKRRGARARRLTARSFGDWARQQHVAPGVLRERMRVVRAFCLYWCRTEPNCFVPDKNLFPVAHQQRQPYIFTKLEIARLLHAADELEPSSNSHFRPWVYRLAIALLYTTGLRRGELVRLLVGDHDARERTLLVRATKFHKSRLLPLSADGAREVERYLQACRDRGVPLLSNAPLLRSQRNGGRGRAYSGHSIAHGLRQLLISTGIRTPEGRTPRVHDLRHAFAVHALIRWYRSGADVQAKLPLLATYMGHVSIASTQHYLSFIQPIRSLTSARFANHYGSVVSGNARAERTRT